MEIKIQAGNILQAESDLAVLATFEDAPLPVEVADLLEPNDYRGRTNQTLLLYPRGASPPSACCWLGWASGIKHPPRRSGGQARLPSRKPKNCKVAAVTIGVNGDLPLEPEAAAQAFAEGHRAWRLPLLALPHRVYLTSRP